MTTSGRSDATRRADARGAQPAQLLGAERRRHRRSSAPRRRGTARRRETASTWTSCPSARESLGDGGRREPSRPWCPAPSDRSRSRENASSAATGSPALDRAGLRLLDEQREEGTRRDAAEEDEVELHRERQRPEHRAGRGALRRCCALADVRASRIACAHRHRGVARSGARQARRGAARHRPFGHAHQDVLDEAADDRRVERDARDAEAAVRARRARDPGTSASGLR